MLTQTFILDAINCD